MRAFYSPEYVCAGYAFDTTRKAEWIAESLGGKPIEGAELCAPVPLTAAEVCAVHAERYVDAVRVGEPRDLAESQLLRWDAQLWPMVLASNGGVVAAVQAALAEGVAGSLSSGMHHAKREHGEGFCTFNGIVIAARKVVAQGTAAVLIVDLDAHCGGGTHSLIRDERAIWHLDVAVSSYDRYTPAGHHTLDVIVRARDYLPTIKTRLEALPDLASFDLCIYGAGMDPDERCAIGGLRGITREMLAEREALVFDWCRRRKIPIAFLLAGGYIGVRLDRDGLVDLHRLTIEAALKR